MSDPSQPPAVPFDFEQTAGFRNSTLYLLRPERVEAVRRFGRLLHDMNLEGSPYWPEDESPVSWEMKAAYADLLHLRDFFGFIGLHTKRDEKLWKPDQRLCEVATELCEELSRMAQRLEKVLA